MPRPVDPDSPREFDVCLSFAGEQRPYIDTVAKDLKQSGVRVFYDDFERVSLWGKDLYEHLDFVYRRAARYCVVFISEDYGKKLWTTHERRSAQARAFEEGADSEYLLPVRFDDTEIPGVRSTIGYIDLRSVEPRELADLIKKKLGPLRRENYLPPTLDQLYPELAADSTDDREAVDVIAHAYVQSLGRMTETERELIARIFVNGCIEELPDNVHVSLDLIRRDLGTTPVETLATLHGLRSVGFITRSRPGEDGDPNDEMVVLSWRDASRYEEDSTAEYWAFERSTDVAYHMTMMAGDFCSTHLAERVKAIDFSSLSSATADEHHH